MPAPRRPRRADHAADRGPRGRRRGRRRRARHGADARLLHDLAASRHRGREQRRQRRACSRTCSTATAAREVRAPRRARHRAEALPRAVRGLRQGPAGHAVLRGSGPPAVRELLLRAGGHPLRGRGARRLHLVGAPAAHADRLGPRQRDEHGRDAGRLRRRSAARRAAGSTSRARASSGRRSPTSPTRACSPTTSSGRRRRRPPRTRPSTSSTATSSAGGGCGRGWPPRSASSPSRSTASPRRSSSRWPTRARSGPRSCAVTACATSDVESLASWWHTDADLGRTVETFTDMGRSRRLGFLGVRDTESSFTDLFARLRAERIVP